jgi:hypothetical protein
MNSTGTPTKIEWKGTLKVPGVTYGTNISDVTVTFQGDDVNIVYTTFPLTKEKKINITNIQKVFIKEQEGQPKKRTLCITPNEGELQSIRTIPGDSPSDPPCVRILEKDGNRAYSLDTLLAMFEAASMNAPDNTYNVTVSVTVSVDGDNNHTDKNANIHINSISDRALVGITKVGNDGGLNVAAVFPTPENDDTHWKVTNATIPTNNQSIDITVSKNNETDRILHVKSSEPDKFNDLFLRLETLLDAQSPDANVHTHTREDRIQPSGTRVEDNRGNTGVPLVMAATITANEINTIKQKLKQLSGSSNAVVLEVKKPREILSSTVRTQPDAVQQGSGSGVVTPPGTGANGGSRKRRLAHHHRTNKRAHHSSTQRRNRTLQKHATRKSRSTQKINRHHTPHRGGAMLKSMCRAKGRRRRRARNSSRRR